MFSSNNHSSNGGNKGKRLSSFFQFGGNNNTGTLASQSTITKNDTGGNTKSSVRPDGTKTPIKSAEDKKAASGKKNPFVPSSKLTTVATDVKSKHSSSHLTSQGSSSHRDNLSLRSTSERTEGSSHRQTSQTRSHHSRRHAINSTDVKKKKTSSSLAGKEDKEKSSSSSSSSKHESNEPSKRTSSSLAGKEDKEKSSSSSSSKHESNGPSKRTSSLGRRPPPPVDLSVLRNSMKRVSEDKQENIGLSAENEWPHENLAVSNVSIKGSPRSIILQGEIVGNSGNEFDLEQHKGEVSEAEKFEEELDTLIKEHNTVREIQTTQHEEFPEKELDYKMDVESVLNTNLEFAGDSNDEDESPFSYVDPLKVSERPRYGRLPTAPISKASPTESSSGVYAVHSSSSPQLIFPPVSNSLETSPSEPLLNPSPMLPPVSSPMQPTVSSLIPPAVSSPMPPAVSSPMPPTVSSPMPPAVSSPTPRTVSSLMPPPMPPTVSSPIPPAMPPPMPPPVSSPVPPAAPPPIPRPVSSPVPPPAPPPIPPPVWSPISVSVSPPVPPPVPSPIQSSKNQVESSSTLQPYPLPSVEVEKYTSGSPFGSTSFTGSEHTEEVSFGKSLSDDAMQDIQQGTLDDTRDASSITSTLYHGDSLDFLTSSGSGNKTPPNAITASLHASPSMNNSSNQHGEKDRSEDYEDMDGRISKNPFSDASVMEQVASMEQPKTIDSDDGSSSRVFDQVSGAQSLDTEVLILPRRKFRVVNEDRPTFYMDDFDGSLNDDAEYDDTARSHDSVNSKGLSVEGSERSSTFIPMDLNNQSLESSTPSAGMRSGFASLDSGISEDDASKNADNPSKAKEGLLTLGHNNLYSRQSVRSNKSNGSSNSTNSSGSVRHDKSVRLVSSYVEELRLKYYRSSNFLQAPPNLPITLKQKNNMVQSKNVKVRIRTSSKQIGIKHGGAKQKLLTLETAHEDVGEDGSMKTPNNKNRINVNHTREFQNLLSQKGNPRAVARIGSPSKVWNKDNDDIEEFMNDIPGDDAYDSDDAMAPLRKETAVSGVTRSSTVKSYFTKQQEKLQDINNALKYEKLPSNININDYVSSAQLRKTMSNESGDSGVNGSFSYGQELRIANPDSSSG